MQEIFDFIKWLWDIKTLLVIAVVAVVFILLYGRILGVVEQHKKVFGKGDKNND